VGSVHFTIYSAEHDFLPGSRQHNWLEQDLANVDRKRTPWLIVAGHRPFYTSVADNGGIPFRQHLRDSIEPLLLKYNVDLGLWGHQHVYERSCGIANGKCGISFEGNVLKKSASAGSGKGVVHAVIGMAGNDYQQPWLDAPEWSIYRSLEFGYSKVKVFNSTHLNMQFYGVNGTVLRDEFWIQHV